MGLFNLLWDPTYVLVLIGVTLSLLTSALVKMTYARYRGVESKSGMTAEQVAQQMLYGAGIYDVQIVPIAGDLTDNYNPTNKTLNLSQTVYGSRSVAAIGVAAHECGHAIQHARSYVFLGLRSAMVPAVNICSTISWPIVMIGFLLGRNYYLMLAGIIFFGMAVLFSIVTLPVEFNASHRALKILKESQMLDRKEVSRARRVLTAAALTYVAAAASMILQLLRLLLLSGLLGNRRD